MEYTRDQLVEIINSKIDEVYTDESIESLGKFVAEKFNQSHTSLNKKDYTVIFESLQYATKLASKQASIATINTLLEMGVIEGDQ